MSDQIFIQHRFTIEEEGYPPFSDAINMPREEFEQLSEAQIEVIKQERFAAYKHRLDDPSVPAEPPIEEQIDTIQAQIDALQEQKEILQEQLQN